MKITKVDLYRYELPLTDPLRLGASTVAHRRGVLVRFGTEHGAVGWGDAAPLTGFSSETLSEVVTSAREAAPRWTGMEIPDGEEGHNHLPSRLPTCPEAGASLRFAVESAAVELLAATRDTSVPDVLGTARSTVALNALITGLNDVPAQAAQSRKQGFRAVKVKVGREELATEVEALRAIRCELGEGVALRADANRAWSLEEAVAFAGATRDLNVAYVEEPLADPKQLPDLTSQTDLPVALDETTREVRLDFLHDGPSVTAIILKPTLLGGLQETRAWSSAAQAHGAVPVISAAYESGIGLRMLVALAAVGPDVPVGLSTYGRLAADVLRPPLQIDGPTIDVASVVDPEDSIDEDRLEQIDAFSA